MRELNSWVYVSELTRKSYLMAQSIDFPRYPYQFYSRPNYLRFRWQASTVLCLKESVVDCFAAGAIIPYYLSLLAACWFWS